MKCRLCGSTVPDVYAKCADCGVLTAEIEQGQTVYCSSCSGKRRAARLAKAVPKRPKPDAIRIKRKAVKPKEDK